MQIVHEAYPLEWPEHQARTPHWQRDPSPFASRSLVRAYEDLGHELGRLGAASFVISSNAKLRSDTTLPLARQPHIADPGAAVYLVREERDAQTGRREPKLYALACDKYESLEENLRALFLTIDSIRRIERHGSSRLMEQALSGFRALTAPRDEQPPWQDVLGVGEDCDLEEALSAYRALIRDHHADKTGDGEEALRLNNAIAEARQELRNRG